MCVYVCRAMVLFMTIAGIIHGRYLIHLIHRIRILIVVVCMITGLTIIGVSMYFPNEITGFYFSFLGCALIGSATVTGENTILGKLEAFLSCRVFERISLRFGWRMERWLRICGNYWCFVLFNPQI